MAALSKQENFAVNTNKSQVYIEDSSNPLCYNYKTDQWSVVTDYAGIGLYSVDSGVNIGLARVSGTAVDLQQPDTSDPKSEATLTTGEASFSDGSRRIITGVRPLITGDDARVSIIYRALLNPESKTNYMLWSEDLSNAAWTKGDATIVTNDAVAPDGTTTADIFAGDGTGTTHYIEQTSQTHPDNSVVGLFFYGKNVDAQYIRIYFDHAQFPTSYLVYDVSTGAARQSNYGSELISGQSSSVGNSWYSFHIRFNSTETTTKPRIALADSNGDELTNSSLGVYVWGVNLSTGDNTNVYTKTVGAVASGSVFQSAEQTVNSRTGVAPFRAESRFHRVKFRVPSGSTFDTILGADVEYQQTGEI